MKTARLTRHALLNARRLLACGPFFLALLVGLGATPSAEAQTLTTLHSFDSTDGASPVAALVQATDGNFYGTTFYGGANSEGTVFKIDPTGTFTALYNFCSQSNCTDGAQPFAGLVQAANGALYGTTLHGGVGGLAGAGTVFKITPNGTLTTLYSFSSQSGCPDGQNPYAGLVQATNGNFYGATMGGGASTACPGGCGTVFKISPSGTFTTLHSFDSTDGSYPLAGLVQAADGDLYGTTDYGGANGVAAGTVFKITPSGALTTLYNFCPQGGRCADGTNPRAGLVQATNGNFYGTTQFGGANGQGTVFKITPGGTLTGLYSFCSQSRCTDGISQAGLIQASDGNLCGTTAGGGAGGGCAPFHCGTLSGSPPVEH